MRNVSGTHIVVIGAARSGVAAAALLKEHGAHVFVSDFGAISPTAVTRLTQTGIEFEQQGHSTRAQTGDFAVISPGVPTESRIVQHYLNEGKEVYSEVEVASWFTSQPIVAVTGSNGKTTVTSWLNDIWNRAGVTHTMGGNIGIAFSDMVPGEGTHILEISSFQLDHIRDFRPAVSVLLNITPDHLDRYQGSVEAYARAKFRITANQQEGTYFIYNEDDPMVRAHAEKLKTQQKAPILLGFSTSGELAGGAFIKNEEIIFRINGNDETLMPVYEIGLKGHHNLQNGMAAALAARASEIKNDAIRESLRLFSGVEHRLESVRTVKGVRYVNDSKATNVNAVWFALDSLKTPGVLILGGRDKGNNYEELKPLLREKIHTIIAIGESKQKIQTQLADAVPDLLTAETMRDAVRLGRDKAKRGETVLLSPACSSFDMFNDYEHRGNVFKEEVNKL